MRKAVKGKLCSDGAETQPRNVGKTWGTKWDFLLLAQLMLSPVGWS